MGSLRHKRSYKRGLFIVLIGCIMGGLLFGTLSFTKTMLQGTSDCTAQPRPDCVVPEKKPIPCPKQKNRPPCPLNVAK